jgi:hypothetical protein
MIDIPRTLWPPDSYRASAAVTCRDRMRGLQVTRRGRPTAKAKVEPNLYSE